MLDLGEAWAIPHFRFLSDNAAFYARHGSATGDPDPLKDGGSEWLKEYLKTCWNLLVRSDVLMRGGLDSASIGSKW